MISSVEARRAARNAGAIAIASILSKGALFAWQLVLARMIGETHYGIYGTVGGFIAIGSSIVNFGMGPIVIRDVARNPSSAGKYLTATLFMQTLLALVAYLVVNGAAALGSYPGEIRAYLALAAISLMIDILGNMCNDLLLAQERMTASSVIAVGHIILLITLAAVALVAGYGLLGVYMATLVAGVARAAVFWLMLKVRPQFPFDRSIAIPLLLNGAPLAISAFLSLAYQHADKLMSARFIGSTETGYLTAAFVIIFGVVELLNTTILIAIYPMMSRYHGSPTFGFIVEKLAFFTLVVSLPIALTLSIFATEITVPLFGPDFAPAAGVLRILIWYAVASMTVNVFAQGLTVQNRQRSLLGLRAAGLATNIALNVLLLPRIGVEGAAVASLTAEILILIFMTRNFTAAGLEWSHVLPRFVRLIALGVLTAVTMSVLGGLTSDMSIHALRPVIGIISGLSLYTGGILVAHVLAPDDWDLLYRLVAAMPGGALVLKYWKRDTVINW
jgi:O-antigen/teichoic acid export membrane protein